MDKIRLIMVLLWATVLQAEETEIPAALMNQVEAGNAESAFFIATAFADGAMGIEQNLDKAKEWFLKSAEMGYVHGMYEIGKLLFSESLHEEARNWFKQAADQGHGEAFYRLSIYPIYGLAEEPFDCEKAYTLLKEAQLRDVKAAFNDHAWMLSTLPDKQCRNGQIAWKIFAELQELYDPMEPIPWAYLDTKAAVFAEIAEFNEAIEVQSWIVEDFCDVDFDADASSFSESLQQLSRQYSEQDDDLCLGAIKRLQSYVNRQPWREEPKF
jgi:TPR repeat protein